MPDQTARLAGLRRAWQGRTNFSLLTSRFGQGEDFDAVRGLWRSDPLRPARLCVFSMAHEALPSHWPPPTRNFHVLDFEAGHVRLLLAQGTGVPWRQPRQLQADLLWVDGRDMPYISACARLSAPGAGLLLSGADAQQLQQLRKSGFVSDDAAGGGHYRYRPHPRQKRPPPLRVAGHAIVVGAGIGGACVAAALASRGWQCTVLDARAQAAGGGSGNPAALFHGTVHGGDGPHARFTRAAALHAQRVFTGLLAQGVPGAVSGLVRAGAGTEDADTSLPSAWVERWQGEFLHTRGSGLCADFAQSAWFFPGGGWVNAAAAVRVLLAAPGIRFQGQAAAASLRREAGVWQVLDAAGRQLAQASVVVLATAGAGDSQAPLADTLLHSAGALGWPLTRSRGQFTAFQHDGKALPWPVAGGGYALSMGEGRLLCGATSQQDDEDPALRDSDHAFNLLRLQAQTGIVPLPTAALGGRVGWRERTPDGLPVLGAALDGELAAALGAKASSIRLAQAARLPGLFVLGALAGRGFTWGPLAGELIASLVDGSPLPLEGDLVDAVDPARFWLRAARQPPPGAEP